MGSAQDKGKAIVKQALIDALSKPVPRDRIIEAQEAEIARLRTELSHTEDRYLDMKKKFDELKVILRET